MATGGYGLTVTEFCRGSVPLNISDEVFDCNELAKAGSRVAW